VNKFEVVDIVVGVLPLSRLFVSMSAYSTVRYDHND